MAKIDCNLGGSVDLKNKKVIFFSGKDPWPWDPDHTLPFEKWSSSSAFVQLHDVITIKPFSRKSEKTFRTYLSRIPWESSGLRLIASYVPLSTQTSTEPGERGTPSIVTMSAVWKESQMNKKRNSFHGYICWHSLQQLKSSYWRQYLLEDDEFYCFKKKKKN